MSLWSWLLDRSEVPEGIPYQKRMDDLNPHARPDTPKGDPEMLSRWGCHKVVSAGKIVSVGKFDADELRVEGVDGIVTFKPAPNMFARMRPIPGDYYVVYDDGYASISPRKAFEEGYHRL